MSNPNHFFDNFYTEFPNRSTQNYNLSQDSAAAGTPPDSFYFQNAAAAGAHKDTSPEDVVHFTAPSKRSSHGAVVAYSDIVHRLRQDFQKPDGINCFGGRLYRSLNEHNTPILVHAIENLTKEQSDTLVNKWHYVLSGKMSQFLIYDHSYELGSSVAITFRIPEDYKSLRELMKDPAAAKYAGTLFKKLIDFLHDYQQYLKGQYYPLCALSLDTVFMDAGHNLHVLPLRSFSNSYPVCYPGEAGKSSADITTDMYTAALVALQFMSGCEYETDGKTMNKCTNVPCLMDCLALFQSWRPSLQTVRHQLAQSAAQGESGYGSYDVHGNHIHKAKPEPNYQPEPEHKPGNKFLDNFFFRRGNRSTYDNVSDAYGDACVQTEEEKPQSDQSGGMPFFR